jgi:hypothetical protein
MSFSTRHIPDVSTLHPAVEGDGLLIAGYASTWLPGETDKVGDRMNPFALDAAVKTFMATNPVLLYSHKVGLPPIGRIIRAEIHRAKGLFIEAVIPRAKDGTFAAEIWQSVKSGLMRALSLGAAFSRRDRGTYKEIFNVPVINEISICPVAIEGNSFAHSIRPTEVKCMSDGAVVLPEHASAYKSLMSQRDQLERRADVNSRIAADLAAHRSQRAELNDVAFAVAKMRVRALL